MIIIIQAPEPEVAVRSIHVSPDGSQVVAANNKGRCYVWKLAPDSKFEPLTHIDAHKSYILKVLYSPDAKYAPLPSHQCRPLASTRLTNDLLVLLHLQDIGNVLGRQDCQAVEHEGLQVAQDPSGSVPFTK
jgi:WD40 repeat protein